MGGIYTHARRRGFGTVPRRGPIPDCSRDGPRRRCDRIWAGSGRRPLEVPLRGAVAGAAGAWVARGGAGKVVCTVGGGLRKSSGNAKLASPSKKLVVGVS